MNFSKNIQINQRKARKKEQGSHPQRRRQANNLTDLNSTISTITLNVHGIGHLGGSVG